MNRPIKVRDFRNKHFFLVDDAYMNGYARHLGPTVTAIYVLLCRHADKQQVAFPSQEKIAQKLGINPRTVMGKIRILRDWNIIQVTRVKNNKGKWLNNTYVLLDKSEWRKLPPTEKLHMDPPTEKLQNPPTEKLYIKDTHIEGYTYKGESSYKHNVIVQDPDFVRLQELRGKDYQRSVALESKLNARYPLWKYQPQWQEARDILNSKL